MAWWLAPIGAAIGGALGKVLGKVADWVPNKKEHQRNSIEKIKREMDALQEKWTKHKATARDVARYESLASKLRQVQDKTKND